jgi:hypothetical protein
VSGCQDTQLFRHRSDNLCMTATDDEPTIKVDPHAALRARVDRLVQWRELDAAPDEVPDLYEPAAPRVLILDW